MTNLNIKVVVISSAVALSCWVTVGIIKIRKRRSPLSGVQEKVADALMSIGITALVVSLAAVRPGFVTGIAATVTVDKGIITLGGPIAVLYSAYKSISGVRATHSLKVTDYTNVKSVIEHQFRLAAFKYYRDWQPELGDFGKVIEDQEKELHFIEDLLPKVFYHGRHELLKPKDVTLTTFFFFSKQKAIKFQRIEGTVRVAPGKRSQIYLAQTPSTPAGRTPGFHFFRSGSGEILAGKHVHGEWKDVQGKKFNLLIVSKYDEDDDPNGDYIFVDVSKYVDFHTGDNATVRFALVSDRPTNEFDIWDVSASLVTTARPVPLIFRRLHSMSEQRKPKHVEKQKKRVSKMLDDWDRVLDQVFTGNFRVDKKTSDDKTSKEEVIKFLDDVRNTMSEKKDTLSFTDFFRALPGVECIVCELKEQQNLILSTFAWGRANQS